MRDADGAYLMFGFESSGLDDARREAQIFAGRTVFLMQLSQWRKLAAQVPDTDLNAHRKRTDLFLGHGVRVEVSERGE